MYEKVSDRTYNVIIGLILLYGFVINAVLCMVKPAFIMNANRTGLVIGYLVLAIIGCCMSHFSDNPIISFIGYNLLVVPMGAVLCVSLDSYYTQTIISACMTTAVITLGLIAISVAAPQLFLYMRYILFFCLMASIVVECICIFVTGGIPRIIDFVIAAVFCCYIGYDWARAQTKTKTVDNAVDSAVDLYLDIINLFVRVLSLTDSKSSKSK